MLERLRQIIHLRLALPTLLLLVGLFLFFGCMFNWWNLSSDVPLFKILQRLGDLILISSVVSFLLDSVAYMGVFKEELMDVIYDTHFLEERKDIEDVWIKVSKALSKSKFPSISTQLMQAIRGYYKPDDMDESKLMYYDNYKIVYTIKYTDESRTAIKVERKTTFTLMVEDDKRFDFSMKFWSCIDENRAVDDLLDISSVKVNGKQIPVQPVGKPEYKSGNLCRTYKFKLKGSTEYEIEQESSNVSKLQDDNYLAFRAKWLVKNMQVEVFHPADMKILFVDRATIETFRLLHDTPTFKKFEYDGLILKKQGYVMILNQQS